VLFERFVLWCNYLILGDGCTGLCRLKYNKVTYFFKKIGLQKPEVTFWEFRFFCLPDAGIHIHFLTVYHVIQFDLL